jgi:hypothetical protein
MLKMNEHCLVHDVLSFAMKVLTGAFNAELTIFLIMGE